MGSPRQGPQIGVALRARWVESQSLKLRTAPTPNLYTYEEIAGALTEVGRAFAHGEEVDRMSALSIIDRPPDGSIFPLDYRISYQGVGKAVSKALLRGPTQGAEELRSLDLARSEELLARLRPAILDASPAAIQAATKLLDHISKIAGYAAPSKLELTGKDGRPVMEQDEEFKLMASRLDENDQLAFLALMNKARGGPSRTEQPPTNGTGENGYRA